MRRSYRGVSPEQRDQQRRARIIAAASRLYAVERTTQVPVTKICRAARVTTRQFYEVFRERDELFALVYENSALIALRYTQEAIASAPDSLEDGVRAMLEALFFADADSEVGQALVVLFLLGATSKALRELRATAVANSIELIADQLAMPRMRSGVLLAAVVQLLEQAWLDHPVGTPQATIDALMDVFLAWSD